MMAPTLFPWLKRKAKAAKEAHGDLVEHTRDLDLGCPCSHKWLRAAPNIPMDEWNRDRPVSEGENPGLLVTVCVTVKRILNCWRLQLLALLSHDQLPKTKEFFFHKLFMVLLRGP